MKKDNTNDSAQETTSSVSTISPQSLISNITQFFSTENEIKNLRNKQQQIMKNIVEVLLENSIFLSLLLKSLSEYNVMPESSAASKDEKNPSSQGATIVAALEAAIRKTAPTAIVAAATESTPITPSPTPPPSTTSMMSSSSTMPIVPARPSNALKVAREVGKAETQGLRESLQRVFKQKSKHIGEQATKLLNKTVKNNSDSILADSSLIDFNLNAFADNPRLKQETFIIYHRKQRKFGDAFSTIARWLSKPKTMRDLCRLVKSNYFLIYNDINRKHIKEPSKYINLLFSIHDSEIIQQVDPVTNQTFYQLKNVKKHFKITEDVKNELINKIKSLSPGTLFKMSELSTHPKQLSPIIRQLKHDKIVEPSNTVKAIGSKGKIIIWKRL